MSTQTAPPRLPNAWCISRRFAGDRSPKAVVQALLRAHMK